MTPEGVEKRLNSKNVEREILDERTREILIGIFCGVVKEGTAKKAKNNLCTIAGKTGTALRTKKGGRGYDPKRSLASFVGFFPADNPRYAGIVMYDEPQTSIYGGEVAAPVFSNIAKRYVSLPRNNAMARADQDDLREELPLTQASIENSDAPVKAETHYAYTKNVFGDGDSKDVLPDFRGKTIRDAYRMARSLGLECEIFGSGLVEHQKPVPGIVIDHVDKLFLYGK
jgi:cell division protein FtsI (penicillin-binding protein 3)